MKTVESTVYQWLRSLDAGVSRPQLEAHLLCHPEYPSLAAITDTLDALHIPNTPLQLPAEELVQIPAPYLVYLPGETGNDGTFEMVKKDPYREINDFAGRWTNIILIAEAPAEQVKSPVSFRTIQPVTMLFVLIGLVALAACIIEGKILAASFIMMQLSGLLISRLILLQDLGIYNTFTGKLCGDNNSCNEVIGNKKQMLFGWLGFADLCVTGFSTLFLFAVVLVFTTGLAPHYGLLAFLSAIAVVPTFYTVYYQAFIVRKWCRLCLAVTAILWIQFFLFLPSLHIDGIAGLSWKTVLLPVALFVLVGCAWATGKLLQKKAEQDRGELFKARRALLSWPVFHAAWKQELNDTEEPFEQEICFGNPDAGLQLVMAVSATCKPCADAFFEAEALLDIMGDDIGIRLRFRIPGIASQDKMPMFRHICSVLLGTPGREEKREAARTWYRHMNFEKFSAVYPQPVASQEDTTQFLRHCKSWYERNHITVTPVLYVNSKKLPAAYTIKDLVTIIGYYPERFDISGQAAVL